MNYEIAREKGKVKIDVRAAATEWDEFLTVAYNKTKGKYNVPGFRKGHAPRRVIENLYGQSVFFDDAFNACASKAYSEVLTANEDIFPVDEPKLDIKEFNDSTVSFTIEVTVKPDVTLGDYKGIKIPKVEYNVTQADVDAEIERARERACRFVDVTDRAITDGDIVKLDYAGSVDGVAFAGGTAENQELTIGSNSFIPGFEEQMKGLKIGEEKDLNVKFPDEYHAEELKGKAAVFHVKVHGIKIKELPKADDEFAKQVSSFDTFAAYKADTEMNLKDTADKRTDNENKNKMVELIVANAAVDVPDCMIESELDYMLSDFEYRLMYAYRGMKLDDYFKYTGSSREDFKKERRADAEKAVKTRLTLEQIIKNEKIEPTEADIDAKLTEIAAQSNKTLEQYKPTVSEQQLGYIKNDILTEKTLNLLVSFNEFVAGEGEKKAAPKAKKAAPKAE